MNGQKKQKSVTPKTRKEEKKRDRAKYRCPKEVESLIDLVNSIPPDRELPHYKDLAPGNDRGHRGVIDAAEEKLRGVPESFFKQKGLELARYMRFRNLRKTVHEVAQIGSLPADLRDQYAKAVVSAPAEWGRFQQILPVKLWRDWSDADAGESPPVWQWPRITLELTINEEGRIELSMERLLWLKGIEANRLRECRKCHRIFWAKQHNIWTCNPRCNNAHRQRRYQEQEALNEQDRLEKEGGSAKTGKQRK